MPHCAQPLTRTPANPAPVACRRFPPTLQLPWEYLVHPGIHFGRVGMRFVEVAGVRTRLTAFCSTCASLCTACHSHACHSGARSLQEVLAYSPTSLGISSAPGNPFWPRYHVSRGSRRAEFKAHTVLLHSLSLARLPLRIPCFAGGAGLLPNTPGTI